MSFDLLLSRKMPIFKLKGAKITPGSSEKMLLGSKCDSVFERPTSNEVENCTPVSKAGSSRLMPYMHMSTMTFELRKLGLNGDNTKTSATMDSSDECVEYTSLPPYKTRSQSVTLAMDMPFLNSKGTLLIMNSCHKQKVTALYQDQQQNAQNFQEKPKEGDCSFRSIKSFSAKEIGKISTQGQRKFCTDNEIVTVKCQIEEDAPTIRGKWFHDVDKLESLKLKISLESIGKERSFFARDWLSGPSKFYKCIQKQRRKMTQAKENLYQKKTCLEKTKENFSEKSQKHVCFAPEILLFGAIEENSTEALKELISKPAVDFNRSVNHKNISSLHRAVELGFADCVRVLLLHGADVNARDLFGRSSLDTAIRTRHFECMVLLVESGPNIADFTKQKLQDFRNVTELSKTCYKSFELEV